MAPVCLRAVAVHRAIDSRDSERGARPISPHSGCAGRAGSRRAHGAAKRVAERGPGSREPVNTRPARENHPLHGDCGTNRPPRTASPRADTPCPAKVLTPFVRYPSRERRRLRPPGAFGRAVRYGWFVAAGRVLTGRSEPGPRGRAFAASGTGRAQPLTRRSAAYIDARHHPVTLRVTPLLREEGKSGRPQAPGRRSRCHPSGSGLLKLLKAPASAQVSYRGVLTWH